MKFAMRARCTSGSGKLWRRACALMLLVCVSGCPDKAPQGPLLEVDVSRIPQADAARARTLWEQSLAQDRRRSWVHPQDQPAQMLFYLAKPKPPEMPQLHMELGWPAGWLGTRRKVRLTSPMRLALELPDAKTDPKSLALGMQLLMRMFWAQVQLSQEGPLGAKGLMDQAQPLALRRMVAQWLGRHGSKSPALGKGCVQLLGVAQAQPRDPELSLLEASVACLKRVGDQDLVPEVLDLMPNGHLRVEMLRVELLGALGGALAQGQLQWVLDQAQEPALLRAASLAMKKARPSAPKNVAVPGH